MIKKLYIFYDKMSSIHKKSRGKPVDKYQKIYISRRSGLLQIFQIYASLFQIYAKLTKSVQI
ncbi:MAG: hypothetical protein AUJ34_01735 [Parcubacteria group bacterium CG1_02_41_12]|nr:MAG: hypothetical protein AUJ34_01735 [Parcubacteria group bacterium CG1_02_41_12]PIP66987.1 MAG: hypothetical protein COW93_02690 [Parcubacteria group bacterium CG22_combo_CG10-13_8_21_14_all_41_9]PIQ80253.1 MAG: hypothetical protein COV79_01455 [Parcubacteria group bacterium CG11_big_fil_rev_8_21_14_0_20_41_14]PIZ79547.1 MAG: hypothetical protein COY02_03840 [Parcubacteria group bacterium CG_4_10_14_0_2_um_filter_41_6]